MDHLKLFKYYKLENKYLNLIEYKTIDVENYNVKYFKIIKNTSYPSVVIVHGLYDHSAVMRNLIEFYLKNSFNVITIDLPGHGLSINSTLTYIDNFDTYTNSVTTIIKKESKILGNNYYLVGHSTGCCCILDIIMSNIDINPAKIILLAPLVRFSKWKLSCLIINILKPLYLIGVIKYLRRNFTESKHEFSFLRNNDIYQTDRLHLSWVYAQIRWYKKLQKQKLKKKIPIYFISGSKDKVVDWEYNLQFLRNNIPEIKIKLLANSTHQLFYDENSNSFFNYLLSIL